jgi:nudix-type nucleoside diphosphatase (YffH/AdpP family)
MKSDIARVRILFDGWTKFLLATLRAPDGAEVERAILDHGMSVAVLPYNAQSRTALLVTQSRAPLAYLGDDSELLEAIAGRIEKETPAAAARREALEEAGLRLGELEPVATCWPSPGVSTERIVLYLSQYTASDRVAQGGGTAAEHESLSIKELPLSSLRQLAVEGQLSDMKTLVLVQALQLRRPDLFD